MAYNKSQLEQMTLEQLQQIAESYGLRISKKDTPLDLTYLILDAQGDKKAEQVQAKADAKTEKRTEKKQRMRIQKSKTEKVETEQYKSMLPKTDESLQGVTVEVNAQKAETDKQKQKKTEKKKQKQATTNNADAPATLPKAEQDDTSKAEQEALRPVEQQAALKEEKILNK